MSKWVSSASGDRRGEDLREPTFAPISELNMSGSLHGAERMEELGPIGAYPKSEGNSESKPDDRADSDVRGQLAGGNIEGVAVGLSETGGA